MLFLTNTKVVIVPKSFWRRNRCLISCAALDADGEEITTDGTIKFCTDLDVDPEDVVLLAVAYELKSPRMAVWSKKGWTDGWKELGYVLCFPGGFTVLFIATICSMQTDPLFLYSVRFLSRCDSIGAMKAALPKLKDKLANDRTYFRKVYLYTFDFARAEGQRILRTFCPSISISSTHARPVLSY